MTQAETTSTTTRRRALSLLAGAAAVPAAAALAIALPAADADAELIALGERLAPLYAAWVESMTAMERDRYETEIHVERLTGVRLCDLCNGSITMRRQDREERPEYWKARNAVIDDYHRRYAADYRREQGRAARDGHDLAALHDRLNELADEAMDYNAATREGIAVQVLAMIYRRADAWEPTLEWDGEAEDPVFKDFLASLAAFTGISFPPFRNHVEKLLEHAE